MQGLLQAVCTDWLMSVETINSGLTEWEECVLCRVIAHVHARRHTHTQKQQLCVESGDPLTKSTNNYKKKKNEANASSFSSLEEGMLQGIARRLVSLLSLVDGIQAADKLWPLMGRFAPGQTRDSRGASAFLGLRGSTVSRRSVNLYLLL